MVSFYSRASPDSMPFMGGGDISDVYLEYSWERLPQWSILEIKGVIRDCNKGEVLIETLPFSLSCFTIVRNFIH